jgi:hypothetical protein
MIITIMIDTEPKNAKNWVRVLLCQKYFEIIVNGMHIIAKNVRTYTTIKYISLGIVIFLPHIILHHQMS